MISSLASLLAVMAAGTGGGEYSSFRLTAECRLQADAPEPTILFHADCHGVRTNAFEVRLHAAGRGEMGPSGPFGERIVTCRSRVDGEGRWNPSGKDVFLADVDGVGLRSRCKNDLEGEWAKLELVCTGGAAVLRINGKTAGEIWDLKPSRGKIAIRECESAFRNVSIGPLPENHSVDVPSPVPEARRIAPGERLSEGLSVAFPAPGRDDGRVYYYVPESVDLSKTTGLVVFLHGGDMSSPETMPEYYLRRIDGQLRPHVDALGYVVAAPSSPATGDHYRWNGKGAIAQIDALIEDAAARFRLDRDRVVLAGHSMGAYGAYQVGAMAADRFAGVWISAGAWKSMDFRPFAGTPVYLQQGRWDCAAAYRQGGPTPRGQNCTGAVHAAAAAELLKRYGCEFEYDLHEGGHALYWEPAQQATQRFLAWAARQRRNPYAKAVAVSTPCGSGLTATREPVARSRWIEIIRNETGSIELDEIRLEGPVFAWTLDQFARQRHTLRKTSVPGARIVARNLGGNKFKAEAENVTSFRILLAPEMGDVSKPFTVDAGSMGVMVINAVPCTDVPDYCAQLRFPARQTDN